MSDTHRGLNESHQRHLVVTFQYVDKLLSEIELVLAAASSKSPFPKYAADLTPPQERVIRDTVARVRGQMIRTIAGLGLEVPGPQFAAIHSIRVHLSFIRVALQEASPKDLAGYGPLPQELIPELNGFSTELQTMVETLDAFLAQEPGRDLEERLDRLTATGDHVLLLKKLERIVSNYGFVEFRPAITNIVDRLSAPRFEIAVFGQVSSGKSSLLNAITGVDALPVGVNPVTSVPTRLVYGPPRAIVSFAGGQVKSHEVGEIGEFVAEERNPANTKGVTRIVVSIPSDRLREGVVFVDTPGLGSLATAGAAETRAYLPQCDLGLVLINASSALTAEDVQLIQTLYVDGIPAIVLLSKCDLATPADRERAARYITEQVKNKLGVSVPVYPVSVLEQYRDLTGKWFKDQIEPLYSRYQELATQSLKRKVALLKDGVATALCSKLGAGARPATTTLANLESAEKTLRTAAGEIREVERKCYALADDLRELGPGVALDQAAQDLANAWRRTRDVPSVEVVQSALNGIATEQARAVYRQLEILAGNLASAIHAASAVLETTPGDETAGFELALRELPQIDLSKIEPNVRRPMIAVFGRAVTAWRAKGNLKVVSSDVEAAFISYARLLQAWMRRALKRITDHFESHAGAYRAQLERLIARTSVSPEIRQKILEDLAIIGCEPPVTPKGADHATASVR